ncbi:MAG: nuclease-related domain-containing protein [Clostridia bacterium]|nr:nuclease-related domain-containing protein [Clostridia bacterium]
MEIFALIIVFLAIVYLPKYNTYRRSGYRNASGNNFWNTMINRDIYGEYLVFADLERLDGDNKLLTNLCVPNQDGSTTEVDLVMISESGIYVFISKNFSGWIFGDEKNNNWTQYLSRGRKSLFFNPVWQNEENISALKSVLSLDNDLIFKSYVVFSERCSLKKITATSSDAKIIKRDALLNAIKQDMEISNKLFSIQDVNLYNSKLKSCTYRQGY